MLFWKTAKQVLKFKKSSADVPTFVLNNEHAEGKLQKANMLNNFFTSQTVVDDSNKTLPNITQPEYALNSNEISIQDVKEILMHLNIYKVCDPELLSSRLLKEGTAALAKPLSILFNRSLEKKVTFQLLGKMQMYRQFIKTMTNHYHLITDRFPYWAP